MKLKSLVSLLTAGAMLSIYPAALPEYISDVSAAGTVVIDASKEYQTIRGFGGINHPEWTGSDMTDAQRKTAFGNGDDELGLTILRIFVNPDKNQWNKALPTAQYATKMGVTVFASPWEPPANLAESGGSNGKLHIPKSNYAAYAQHLNDFGTYMKNNNVDLYAISVQNEPDYASEWTYWSTDETTDFIANYVDKITSTRLMSPESFQYAPENASWVPDGGKKFYKKILNNQKAFENCDVFGTHFYGTQRAWMDFPELENCGKEIWMTEVYVPNSDQDSANRYPEALDVSENIHNAMVVGNMSAYTWWYIRRHYGLMTEDGKISKRGYCMAQYSKYVRPGDVRIEATEQPADNVYISAYKGDDNQINIVAINKGSTGYTQEFEIDSSNISDVDRYRTSANENLAATLDMEYSGNSFFAQLPAESVSTFVVTLSDGTDNTEPDENGYYFHDTFEENECSWEQRGSVKLDMSGRSPYEGTNALLISERTAAWNGVQKKLGSSFKAGNEYSFSVDVLYLDSENTSQKFALTLQYKDSAGETKYANIDTKTAVKGKYVQLSNKNYKIPEGASDIYLVVETLDGSDNFYIDEAVGAAAGTVINGPAEIKFTYGDVNSDGNIDCFDVSAAKFGMIKGFSGNISEYAADVNQNGAVDSDDIKQLKAYIMGQISEFKISETEKSAVTPAEYMKKVSASITENEAAGSTDEKSGVSYGTFEKKTFYSDVCGRNKNINVLLPAGYSQSKKYPVLYALHGYWGNEDSLLDAGDASLRLRQIIGNAIASGDAEDMIVVFPDIYASATQDKCDGLNDKNNAAYDNFINVLTKEIMPYMEQNYSIKTGRDNTAITGFSMGGRESLYIGFSRPDLFGYVGAMCPAPGLTTDLIKSENLKFSNTEPYLLMVSAGSDDQVVFSTPSGYNDTLNSNNVNHIWHYVTGGDHGGKTIRPHMYNFVRSIFKA
ncbi:MAG TPA: hypothetical protein DD392_03455 [Ruminococcus sp.]|nr:hypothetical protein [Ruminococcus sp.]